MRVLVGSSENERCLFAWHTGRVLFDQPSMHKYGWPFILAAVQDEILIGGNFFPVGVSRFHFQAIASGGKFAEYDRRYFISCHEGPYSHQFIDFIPVCTEYILFQLFVRQGINRVTSLCGYFLSVHCIGRYHSFGGIVLHFLSGHLDIQQDACVADGEGITCFLCFPFAVGQSCCYFVALEGRAHTQCFRPFGYEGDREVTFIINFSPSVSHLLMCRVEWVRHVKTCPERVAGDRPVYLACLKGDSGESLCFACQFHRITERHFFLEWQETDFESRTFVFFYPDICTGSF